MSTSLEQRLTELEMRIAFIDDTMTALSDAVAVHDRHLQDLRGLVERLQGELGAVRGSLGHEVGEEPPPPHY